MTVTSGERTPHSVPYVLTAAMGCGYDSYGLAWGSGEHGERWEARIAASDGALDPVAVAELEATLAELKSVDGGTDLRVLGDGSYAVVILLGGAVIGDVESHARAAGRDALARMCRVIAEAWSASLIEAV